MSIFYTVPYMLWCLKLLVAFKIIQIIFSLLLIYVDKIVFKILKSAIYQI